jgi:DNA-binding NarL/FixJ family response regulator
MKIKFKFMKNRGLNLFIVAEHALVVNGLKHYLENRFGSNIQIHRFYNSRTCLKKINKNTGAVVLDEYLNGRKGDEILQSIKTINPQTEGIIYSSSEQVAAYVDMLLYRKNKILEQKAVDITYGGYYTFSGGFHNLKNQLLN